jgi:hypothetical protein
MSIRALDIEEEKNLVAIIVQIVLGQVFLMLDNYVRYSEKVELFISRHESQVQGAKEKSQKVQLENILNGIQNGILILRKIPEFTF